MRVDVGVDVRWHTRGALSGGSGGGGPWLDHPLKQRLPTLPQSPGHLTPAPTFRPSSESAAAPPPPPRIRLTASSRTLAMTPLGWLGWLACLCVCGGLGAKGSKGKGHRSKKHDGLLGDSFVSLPLRGMDHGSIETRPRKGAVAIDRRIDRHLHFSHCVQLLRVTAALKSQGGRA